MFIGRASIENFERNLQKMNELNLLIFFQNFRKFQCIFDFIITKILLFEKVSFNFRSIKIKMFPFPIKKIVFLQKNKILKERSKIVTKFAKILNEFCKFSSTKIFVFVHIFVGWTKFSRKRLNENLETLIRENKGN